MKKSYDNVVIDEIQFDSISDFLKEISITRKLYDELGSDFIFRGLSSDKYELVPSVLRNKNGNRGINRPKAIDSELKQIRYEYSLLSDFFRKCDDSGLKLPNVDRLRSELYVVPKDEELYREMWLPDTMLELAALAQHYGVPTRLLDWTHDINVALYFALSGCIKDNEEIDLDTKIVIWAFDTLFMNLGLKDSPLKIVRPPYSGNPNLAAQKGVFTFWRINPMESVYLFNDKFQPQNSVSLDSLVENYLKEHGCLDRIMFKFTISIKDFLDAFDYLSRNRYTASYLFPGYAGVARSMYEEGALSNLICEGRL